MRAPATDRPGTEDPGPRAPVRCRCGHLIWTGEVIKARVVNVRDGTAKCRRCQRWVAVPVRLAEDA